MEVFVKKIIFTSICAALLMSCGSSNPGMANSAITEAQTMQDIAKSRGVEVPAATSDLIASAQKQKEDDAPEAALVLADEATLQLQLSLLKQENKNMEDSIKTATNSLSVIRNTLNTTKNANKK